ncbi:MAG: DUF4832 domain-containing protein [Clostridia bacterium]|nr:DUF4832 domain-containing protein [Clostridia bacterium]
MKTKILAISIAVAIAIISVIVIVAVALNRNKDEGGSENGGTEQLPPEQVQPPEDDDGEENKTPSYRQQLDYTESLEQINNPDQGFYRPLYVKVTESGAEYNKNIVTAATQLYHLRIDISAFSAAVNGAEDKPLTAEALSGIAGALQLLNDRQKSAVVRFCYAPSYSGAANKEPQFDMILRHIEQFCGVLNDYEATITAVETGLIGPWGEMHTSTIANKEHISPIIDKLLDCTQNLAILVRTPKMIYNYLGITEAEAANYAIPKDGKAYRLGIYNDGYLGSSTDLGTYTDRERDIAFIANQSNHLPYGGEVVIPTSELHDIDKCLPEIFQIHLSYLNIEWHNLVIDKWKQTNYTADCGGEQNYYGQSAFTYISNRMGYRFVVRDSVFSYADNAGTLEIKLNIENVGFGNLTKEKKAKLIFVDGEGQAVKEVAVQSFTGGGEIIYNVTPQLEEGEYSVYLCVYGADDCAYAVQFANKDIWNADLAANYIGKVNYI